jgi:hypothetical protein
VPLSLILTLTQNLNLSLNRFVALSLIRTLSRTRILFLNLNRFLNWIERHSLILLPEALVVLLPLPLPTLSSESRFLLVLTRSPGLSPENLPCSSLSHLPASYRKACPLTPGQKAYSLASAPEAVREDLDL